MSAFIYARRTFSSEREKWNYWIYDSVKNAEDFKRDGRTGF